MHRDRDGNLDGERDAVKVGEQAVVGDHWLGRGTPAAIPVSYRK